MNTQLHSVGAASREFGRKNGNGAGDDDSGDGTASLVRAEFKRLGAEFSGFASARKVKEAELDARLLAIEQRQARLRGSAGGGGDDFDGKGLGEAAEPLVQGLKEANSSKTRVGLSAKALSSTGAGAVGTPQYAVPIQSLGPIDTFHSPVVRLLDVLPVVPITGNMVDFVRVTYATNAAAKAVELTDKAESLLSTEHVMIEAPTWAHFVGTSRQVLADVATLRGLLDSLLQRGLLDKIDAGIFAAITAPANCMPFVFTTGDRFADAIARAAAMIVNNGGRDVVVAINPLDFLSMSLAKAVTSGEYLGTPPSLATRIVATASVAPGKVLAFAPGTGAAYADRQAVTVEAGYTGTGFTANRVTLLCEARGMVIVRDPGHVAYGSLPLAA